MKHLNIHREPNSQKEFPMKVSESFLQILGGLLLHKFNGFIVVFL